MKKLLILSFSALFLSSCYFSGSRDRRMRDDCKCEEVYWLGDDVFIEAKQGHVVACGRRSGDSLSWGFIIDNEACDPFLPFVYDDAKDFYQGLAPVSVRNKWGAIDTSGRLVIEYRFKDLKTFADSVASFQDGNELWGVVNAEGQILVEAEYDYVSHFWANLALTHDMQDAWKTGWTLINSRGEIMPVQIDSLGEYYPPERAELINVMRDAPDLRRGGQLKQKSIYDEVMIYPVFSNGIKLDIIAFRNKYALVPYSEITADRRERIDIIMPDSILMPIFSK